MRVLLPVLFLLLAGTAVFAQKPYFQQEVKYTIHVALDHQNHFLRGNEEVVYINKSPDVLSEIYFHLWPNAYNGSKTAFARQQLGNGSTAFHFAGDSTRGFIDSLNFSADGEILEWKLREGAPDIAILKLKKPLAPGASVTLRTPFRVKIPGDFSRMGHVGKQYQITQWYPKPAVYDNEGWHAFPYVDQGEFYSEFGTFDVYITLAKNFVIGATGDLPANDPENGWLAAREKLSRSYLEKDDTRAADIFPEEFGWNEVKTLHFHQENVHDFAWFCDPKYYVLSDTVKLPLSGREVRCVAMFSHSSRNIWKNAPLYIGRATLKYSEWNGEYPYRHVTAVDGALKAGGGMEYPNITVVSAGGTSRALDNVIMHEVGHNWFYGILASEERAHPWMDEGLNSFMEYRYMREVYRDSSNQGQNLLARISDGSNTNLAQQLIYTVLAMSNLDQPIEMHAEDYTSINYGGVVYTKTALAFQFLEAYLSRPVMDRCWHAYFEAWKFRHPKPADLQKVFEETSGKDLEWFFGPYLSGTDKPDFRIKNIKDGTVTLRNSSSDLYPIGVTLLSREDKPLDTLWTQPVTGKAKLEIPAGTEFHHAMVNYGGAFPELHDANNRMRAKGIFRHCKPIQFKFGFTMPGPRHSTINFLPVAGINTTDGFMAGMLLYHNFIPKQPFSFHLMPMYGFRSRGLTGSAGFTLRWLPSSLGEITFRHRTAMYADILRSRHTLKWYINPKDLRDGAEKILTLNVWNQGIVVDNELLPEFSELIKPVFAEAEFRIANGNALHSSSLLAHAGTNVAEKLLRLDVAGTYSRKITRKLSFALRAFGGYIFDEGDVPGALAFGLSGSGDPFGDQILFDRAGRTGWLSHQVVQDQGNFHAFSPLRYSQALFTANGELRFLVFRIFADAGWGANYLTSVEPPLQTAAGISIALPEDIFRINIPIAGSVFTNGLPGSGDEFLSRMNFSMDLMRLLRANGANLLRLY